MYVYAADVANTITRAGKYGIDASLDGVRWRDIRDRIFGRIDSISESGKDYRVNGPNTTAFLGHATFTGPNALHIDTGDDITADQIVIAAGGHPTVPVEVTDSGVPFHTSDTIMRLDELPKSLVILGSGFIAAEFAHIFSAFGSKVTIVARHDALLRQLDTEISQRFTAVAQEQWDVRLNTTLTKVTGDETEVRLDFADGSHASGDILLVATGRLPNTTGLGLEQAGIEERLKAQGRRYVSKTQAYGDTAYGWAMEDTTGVCKLLADPATGELLGAHLMGYQASNLIAPLIQGMSFGQTVQEMALGQYWIHPALTEVVENALLGLGLTAE